MTPQSFTAGHRGPQDVLAIAGDTGRSPLDVLDDFRGLYYDTALSSSSAALPTLLAFPTRTCPLRQRLAVRPRHREPVLRQRPRPRCPPGHQPHQRRNPHPPPDRHCRTDALIDTCVISYEQGREKPDPHLFLKACGDLGTDPRATLMVGDNPIRDGGAAACGLRTYILPSEHRTGERGLADVLRIVA
ncbi:HAD-IA family hydrolase [Streptomyces canus]|uniref:HAD family hydrolase n=1 Tax=Streptomyces canus TaxID=58343 RepID=UPI002E2A3629|nr:HAD-IA family hydrolase [Streptomyces canus]